MTPILRATYVPTGWRKLWFRWKARKRHKVAKGFVTVELCHLCTNCGMADQHKSWCPR